MSAFDLDLRDGLVGIRAVRSCVPVLLAYSRSDLGDFLTLVSECPVGTTLAAGPAVTAALALAERGVQKSCPRVASTFSCCALTA